MSKRLSDMYAEYEEYEHEKSAQERNELLMRKENFEREQLDKKLKSIDSLTNSILLLANSLIMSSSNDTPIINLYLDKNTSPDRLNTILDQFGVVKS